MSLKHQITKNFILAGFGIILGLSSAHAQQLIIPIGSQAKLEILKPSKGMDMNTVLSGFGEPLQRRNPVGEPPITRWQYEHFSVYFESEVVIHSVVHFVPIAVEQTIEKNQP